MTGPFARVAGGEASACSRAAGVAASVLALAIGLAVVPLRDWKPGFSAPLLLIFGVSVFLIEAFSAVLLAWRARLVGDAATAVLAATFAFAAPLIPASVAMIPRIGPAWFVHPEGAAWTYTAWFLGWPLGILAFTQTDRTAARRLRARLAGALLASIAMIVLAGFSPVGLPAEIGPGGTLLLSAYVAGALALAADGAALWALLRRRDRMTTLEVWLVVALVTFGVSLLLVVASPDRFGFTTYVARGLALASSLIVLLALLAEFAHLVGRAGALDRSIAMAESAPTIVYVTDVRGACTYVNHRWTEMTGQAPDAALGYGWRSIVHPADVDADATSWQSHVAAIRPHEAELRFRSRDGTYRWHLTRATPVRGADGSVVAWYGSATDIHDQRLALEEALRLQREVTRLFEREHRIAEALQSAFIPAFLPRIDGLHFDAVYRPALRELEVGGDWYDAFALRYGRLALVIGDVAGHGLEAATAMLRLRETLRAVVGMHDDDPAEVLRIANTVYTGTSVAEIATAAFATFDPRSGRLTYACAGHPPPVLLRNGRAVSLPSGGIPLGVMPSATFVNEVFVLGEGDALVLYTDGLVEAERDVLAGEERLLRALETYGPDASTIAAELLREHQRDDVALLAMSISRLPTGTEPAWRFRSDDARSAHAARASFREYLVHRQLDPDVLAAAELAFGELVGNVVRHAPGPIEINLAWDGATPILSVADRGRGFIPAGSSLPQDVLAESGRGLFLIRVFAGDPEFVLRRAGGTEARVRIGVGESEVPFPR